MRVSLLLIQRARLVPNCVTCVIQKIFSWSCLLLIQNCSYASQSVLEVTALLEEDHLPCCHLRYLDFSSHPSETRQILLLVGTTDRPSFIQKLTKVDRQLVFHVTYFNNSALKPRGANCAQTDTSTKYELPLLVNMNSYENGFI